MAYVFPPPPTPVVAVKGRPEQFAVHRIYCVGRNYAAHAREMGANPEREPPFFFAKPATALVPNHAPVPYPSRTHNFHHEIELVVAIGKGGREIPAAQALDHVFGYAVGNDLTRRDLQSDAKDNGRPWDTSKGFDHSAVISAITSGLAVGTSAQRPDLAARERSAAPAGGYFGADLERAGSDRGALHVLRAAAR
jgi:fumarylpyruvate hydrolase